LNIDEGMLERWNIGIMGFDLRPIELADRRGYWTVIPSFHYSIIP
jgi:hypothetical protein